MRRADRLFDIIQLLRQKPLVRARDLAAALEVSERTIYRDVASLIASGVPVEGEAGVGYMLRDGYDLPPLMFDEDELDALVLGARIVEGWADQGLAEAARRVLAKVEAVLPEHMRAAMREVPIDAPGNHHWEPITVCRGALRRAVRARRKVRLLYCAKSGEVTERVVRPLLLSFYGSIWNLSTWCELRGDFRTFRVDLIREAEVLPDGFVPEPGRRLADLMAREGQG